MTSVAHRESAKPAPLGTRIREAEQRLADRQRSTRVRAAALGRALHDGLSSPITLLVAAGAGFTLGQFSKRKRAQTRADADPPPARPPRFAALMDALSLVTTVMAMLPALRREPARDSSTAGEAP